jgi:CBS domain-containing protein
MNIGEICCRQVVHVEATSVIIEAARLMRKYHVGDIVVTEKRDGNFYPVGILTDRDIVIEVLACEVDPEAVTVGDVMGPALLTLDKSSSVEESLDAMRNKGYRRVLVVDERGVLVGILSLDDILGLLSEEMANIAGLIQRGQEQELRLRH